MADERFEVEIGVEFGFGGWVKETKGLSCFQPIFRPESGQLLRGREGRSRAASAIGEPQTIGLL